MYEPEHPDPTIPQGITYVRIDEERVLKIRISLDFPHHLDSCIVSESTPDQGSGNPPLPSPMEAQLPPMPLPEFPPPVKGEDDN